LKTQTYRKKEVEKEREATDRAITKQTCHEVDDDVGDIGADVAPTLAIPSQQQLQQTLCRRRQRGKREERRGSWFDSK
jgi:hypothetical protein